MAVPTNPVEKAMYDQIVDQLSREPKDVPKGSTLGGNARKRAIQWGLLPSPEKASDGTPVNTGKGRSEVKTEAEVRKEKEDEEREGWLRRMGGESEGLIGPPAYLATKKKVTTSTETTRNVVKKQGTTSLYSSAKEWYEATNPGKYWRDLDANEIRVQESKYKSYYNKNKPK